MLELLYSTKIRVSELIALNMQDVNMEMSYIICHDIKKDRAMPFGERAGKALEEYVENAGGKLLKDEKEQTFFVNCSGSGMSRQRFWKLLKNYARAAQITKEITPQISGTPLLIQFCQVVDEPFGGFPAKTCVGDGFAVYSAADFLAAFFNIAFYHHAFDKIADVGA